MKIKTILVAVILAAAFTMTAAGTEQSAGTSDIGYYVRAVLPPNQTDQSLGYFDLRMEPAGEQELHVEVVNESDQQLRLAVDSISASTNRNGVIDYKTPEIRDVTLKYPFAELARIDEPLITVEPQSTSVVSIRLTMPDQQYDGSILGGLVFTKQDPESSTDYEGAVIRNIYSYVIGVVLHETDVRVTPDFELNSISVDSVNYMPSIVHQIRNKEAAIAKNIKLDVVIKDSSGKAIAEISKSQVDMAPNSVMPLAVTVAAGPEEATVQKLTAGSYHSEVRLEYEGEIWNFAEAFTIGRTEAEQVNSVLKGTVSEPLRDQSGLIGWLYLIIIFLLCLIVALVLRMKDRKQS